MADDTLAPVYSIIDAETLRDMSSKTVHVAQDTVFQGDIPAGLTFDVKNARIKFDGNVGSNVTVVQTGHLPKEEIEQDYLPFAVELTGTAGDYFSVESTLQDSHGDKTNVSINVMGKGKVTAGNKLDVGTAGVAVLQAGRKIDLGTGGNNVQLIAEEVKAAKVGDFARVQAQHAEIDELGKDVRIGDYSGNQMLKTFDFKVMGDNATLYVSRRVTGQKMGNNSRVNYRTFESEAVSRVENFKVALMGNENRLRVSDSAEIGMMGDLNEVLMPHAVLESGETERSFLTVGLAKNNNKLGALHLRVKQHAPDNTFSGQDQEPGEDISTDEARRLLNTAALEMDEAMRKTAPQPQAVVVEEVEVEEVAAPTQAPVEPVVATVPAAGNGKRYMNLTTSSGYTLEQNAVNNRAWLASYLLDREDGDTLTAEEIISELDKALVANNQPIMDAITVAAVRQLVDPSEDYFRGMHDLFVNKNQEFVKKQNEHVDQANRVSLDLGKEDWESRGLVRQMMSNLNQVSFSEPQAKPEVQPVSSAVTEAASTPAPALTRMQREAAKNRRDIAFSWLGQDMDVSVDELLAALNEKSPLNEADENALLFAIDPDRISDMVVAHFEGEDGEKLSAETVARILVEEQAQLEALHARFEAKFPMNMAQRVQSLFKAQAIEHYGSPVDHDFLHDSQKAMLNNVYTAPVQSAVPGPETPAGDPAPIRPVEEPNPVTPLIVEAAPVPTPLFEAQLKHNMRMLSEMFLNRPIDASWEPEELADAVEQKLAEHGYQMSTEEFGTLVGFVDPEVSTVASAVRDIRTQEDLKSAVQQVQNILAGIDEKLNYTYDSYDFAPMITDTLRAYEADLKGPDPDMPYAGPSDILIARHDESANGVALNMMYTATETVPEIVLENPPKHNSFHDILQADLASDEYPEPVIEAMPQKESFGGLPSHVLEMNVQQFVRQETEAGIYLELPVPQASSAVELSDDVANPVTDLNATQFVRQKTEAGIHLELPASSAPEQPATDLEPDDHSAEMSMHEAAAVHFEMPKENSVTQDTVIAVSDTEDESHVEPQEENSSVEETEPTAENIQPQVVEPSVVDEEQEERHFQETHMASIFPTGYIKRASKWMDRKIGPKARKVVWGAAIALVLLSTGGGIKFATKKSDKKPEPQKTAAVAVTSAVVDTAAVAPLVDSTVAVTDTVAAQAKSKKSTGNGSGHHATSGNVTQHQDQGSDQTDENAVDESEDVAQDESVNPGLAAANPSATGATSSPVVIPNSNEDLLRANAAARKLTQDVVDLDQAINNKAAGNSVTDTSVSAVSVPNESVTGLSRSPVDVPNANEDMAGEIEEMRRQVQHLLDADRALNQGATDTVAVDSVAKADVTADTAKTEATTPVDTVSTNSAGSDAFERKERQWAFDGMVRNTTRFKFGNGKNELGDLISKKTSGADSVKTEEKKEELKEVKTADTLGEIEVAKMEKSVATGLEVDSSAIRAGKYYTSTQLAAMQELLQEKIEHDIDSVSKKSDQPSLTHLSEAKELVETSMKKREEADETAKNKLQWRGFRSNLELMDADKNNVLPDNSIQGSFNPAEEGERRLKALGNTATKAERRKIGRWIRQDRSLQRFETSSLNANKPAAQDLARAAAMYSDRYKSAALELLLEEARVKTQTQQSGNSAGGVTNAMSQGPQ